MGMLAKEKMLGNIPEKKPTLQEVTAALKPSPITTKIKEIVTKPKETKPKTIKPPTQDVLKALIQSVKPGNKSLPGYEQTGISARQAALLALTDKYRSSPTALEDVHRDLLLAKSKKMSISEFVNQYKGQHPVYIPSSEFGRYDRVRVGYPVTDESGNLTAGYLFEYSPKAKHMINVAGSIDNYNAYLREVRKKDLLPVVNAVLGGSFNLDLAFASNKPGSTGASEREEILIKLLHRYKGSPEGGPELVRTGSALLGSGPVQIGLALAGGAAVGKVAGGVSGYLMSRWGPSAVQAFNLAQMAGGTALTLPKVVQIAEKAAEGKTGKAAEEAVMLGILLASGIAGYRYGKSLPKFFGKGKGLTEYEYRFIRGLDKSKLYDPVQKEYLKILSEIKQDLRIRHVSPPQEEPTYMNVEALKKYNQQKADILRTVIKNQLIALKHKAQISGGAGTEKPSTHDIDELFRSAKDPVVLEYIARKLGIDPNLVFDPHQLPRTGAIVTRGGTPKEPGYIHPSGQQSIRFTEQFYRLGDSAPQLAHAKRLKDISEAVRMLDMIYGKTGGIPTHMQPKVQRFLELSAILEQDPRIMDPALSKLLYESGISKKLWNVRMKFYRKVLPETYLSKQFQSLSNTDLQALQNFITMRTSGGLPPSMSMAFAESPYAAGSWGAFFRSLVSGSKPSALPSYPSAISSDVISSGYPSDSESYISSYEPSPKTTPRRKSTSKPYDDTYPSPSQSYPTPGSVPPYYPSDYSRIPPSYPSPSSPGYPYPSYPSYPDTEIPPPPPGLGMLFPGLGGRIASAGRAAPFAVKYYNEYEMIQRILRNVIF